MIGKHHGTEGGIHRVEGNGTLHVVFDHIDKIEILTVHILIYGIVIHDHVGLAFVAVVDTDAVLIGNAVLAVHGHGQGDVPLGADKVFIVVGGDVVAPAHLVVASAPVCQLHVHHLVVVDGGILIQLGGNTADSHNGRACKPLDHVCVMHTAVDEGRAILHETDKSVPRVAGLTCAVALVHTHHAQLTDLTCVDQGFDLAVGAVVAQHVGNGDLAGMGLRQTDELPCILQIGGDGLLTDHVLAVTEAFLQNGEVGIRIGSDDHDLHPGIL